MKKKVLEILKSGEYCSGERISQKLNVSRTAVWKYVKKLKEDGYKIESVTNKGYRLISSPDLLTEAEITDGLATKYIGKHIFYCRETDSTNNEAKRNNSAPEGSVFIAEIQSGGKGRLGRKWLSEDNGGIWMTILLKPRIALEEISKITLAAGAAVCKAFRGIGLSAGIKWPNDIVVNGRKICGILTELSAEADGVNYVALGIGINVNIKAFPKELENKATSVFIETGAEYNRAKLVRAVFEEFEKLYEEFLSGRVGGFIKDYKAMCITVGKNVRVIKPDCEFDARAVDIDREGRLIVETEKGKMHLNSGEVSVRGIYGYI